MSLPHSTPIHPTVAELVQLENDGSIAKTISAMASETLDELDDRLTLALDEIREAKMQDERLDDLVVLAARVRYSLRQRRARATLDDLLGWAPR